MRQTLLAAAAAFIIGGATVGSVLSYAQPAPSAAPAADATDATVGQMHQGGMMMRRAMWRHGRHARPFALIYTPRDRKLTPDDVQKIAQGFLLWRGNHDWKVVDVSPQSDGAIGFSLATESGSVVAKFSMNPHTGRIQRLG